MTDFSTLTNDELKEAGQAWFAEVESRIEVANYPRILKIIKTAHNALNIGAAFLVDDNQITALEGDDK